LPNPEPDGIVLETDQYFYSHVGDDPSHYDYREELLPAARRWNLQRFCDAIGQNTSPIVVDRGNGLNVETQKYARFAVERGYRVELREPQSQWWQELRILLKYRRELNAKILDQWADLLAAKSQANHRVPAMTIRRWMDHWKHALSVQQILDYVA
jgi:hypothetical protein